jgi:hypothetical protein
MPTCNILDKTFREDLFIIIEISFSFDFSELIFAFRSMVLGLGLRKICYRVQAPKIL